MNNGSTKHYRVRFISSMKEIDAVIWNSVVGSTNPFLKHEFLLALEQSGCTSRETGWQANHLLVEVDNNKTPEVIALLPLYIKTNSTGEYVFDWNWADAYHQHGVVYYPKLVSAIPFTPSAGPRISVSPAYDRDEIIQLICQQLPAHAKEINASSWHLLFPNAELSQQLKKQGIQQRIGCQYQWFNHQFTNFDDFLERFSSRKRKNIKKERSKIKTSGITFEVIEGKDISLEHWQKFYLFYQNTYYIRGRQPYLNEEFFLQIGASMPESLLLVMAVKNNQFIAGALSFKDSDTLYGRYWGCLEEFQFLHFETCYYLGIEYCIQHRLNRFDSGAQGEHKIQRGFEPVLTYSNHWIGHPQFSDAIGHFLKEEKNYIQEYIQQVRASLPFKKET